LYARSSSWEVTVDMVIAVLAMSTSKVPTTIYRMSLTFKEMFFHSILVARMIIETVIRKVR